MKTRIPAASPFVLLAVLTFSLFLAGSGAQAATLALKFNSLGVYPQLATANSQRWFRCNITWDNSLTNAGTDANPVWMVNERIVSLTLHDSSFWNQIHYNTNTNVTPSYTYGGNLFSTVPATVVQNGAKYGAVLTNHSVGTTGNYDITVGPFAGYNYSNLVGSVQIGTMASGGAGADLPRPFNFDLVWQKWDNTNKVYVTQPTITVTGTMETVPLSTGGFVGNSGEIMYWYSSDGHGINPLTVTQANPTDPDQGSSSSDYIFRVVYWRFGITPPAHWRATPTDPDTGANLLMPAEGDYYARFDKYAYDGLTTGTYNDNDKQTWLDTYYGAHNADPYRNWLYNIGDPHMDWIGSHQAWSSEGQVLDPEVILILDNNFSQPYYMRREQLLYNGKQYENVYRYDMIPTNYMQALHNIWQFPFDLTGSDQWDMFTQDMQGWPVSNTYSALPPGVHSYQFIATRDWDPPVGKIVDSYTGQTHIGRQVVALYGQPGESMGGALIVRDGLGVPDDTPAPSSGVGIERVPAWNYIPSHEAGYGYPYDARQYPKVNPGLSAFPYVPMGLSNSGEAGLVAGTYPGSLPNPFQAAFSSPPWGPTVGPQPPNMWYTNDDTIWPNLFNIDPANYPLNPAGIYDYNQREPLRGGKWTTNTNFVFRINYWQSNNLAPQAAQIFIRKIDPAGNPTTGWMPHSMLKVDPSNNNYAAGVVYYYQATAASLPGGGGPGDYNYYFSFSDGTNTAIFPNRPGAQSNGGVFPNEPNDWGTVGVPGGANPWYWFRVNHAPVLNNPTLSPGSGTQGTDYVFGINYSDQDGEVGTAAHQGDPPYKSICWIDLFGDPQGQMQVKSIAGSKITYGFVPTSYGSHVPYAAGSLVGPQNGQPMQVNFSTGAAVNQQFTIMANAVVTPGANGSGTITVTGTPTGVAVGDQFQVCNWFPVTMYQKNAALTNYTTGVNFLFDTAHAGMVLNPGVHNYYFEYWDNWGYWPNWQQYFGDGNVPANFQVEGEMVRSPVASGTYYQGPTVIPNQPPAMSGIYFAPPAADTVAKVVDATHLDYIRPVGRIAYANNSLAGLYLEFQTGQAALRVYQVTANTTTVMTLKKVSGAGDLLSDQVVLGDTFRIFMGWSAAAGLSYSYHQNPSTTFDGTPGTDFTLYATYSSPDDNPPATIRAAVYSSATQPASSPDAVYDMVPVVSSANTFVSGVLYQTVGTVAMAAGQHWLRVQANDGNSWYAGGVTANNWFGPALNPAVPAVGPVVIVNHPPNPPVSGFAPANDVSVNTATPTLRWDPATDPDPGDSVVAYTVQLSKTGFTNGVYDYQYFTTSNSVLANTVLSDLTTWSWRVKSQDTLGAQSGWSAVQTFYVNLNMPAGVLAPPGGVAANSLTPVTGDLSTTFTYSVVYTNTANIAPPSGVYVEIDGTLYPTPLSPPATGPYNYVTGVTYTLNIRGDAKALGYGQHNYRFFAGAVAWPAAGGAAETGPWIDSPATLSLDDATWAPLSTLEAGATLYVQLSDPDKAKGYPSLNVVVTAGTDTETVKLNHTAAGSSLFRGSLKTVNNAGKSNNGVLNVEPGASGVTATATYTDPATVGSPKPDVAKATVLVVDTTPPPVVAPVTIKSGPQGVSLTLDWAGYKPPVDLAGYHVWFSPAPFSNESGLTAVATLKPGTTSYEITGLQPEKTYYAAVTAFDRVPNEIKTVPGVAVKTQDTTGPDISAETPAAGASGVALDAAVSFTLDDPSGINLSSLQVQVNGATVSPTKLTLVPATGTPTSVQVSFTGSFAWNEKVTVDVKSADTLGNLSDHSWKFSVVTDTTPPHVANLSPKQGATGVPVNQTLSFDLLDAISGVNVKTIGVTVNGAAVSPAALTINSTNLNDVIVSYTPPAPGLPVGATVTVVINASDVAGNAMKPFPWTFTTLYAISGTITTANGKGLAGVTITDGIVTATTAADGTYKLVGVANGHYEIKPSLLYYRFDPVSTSVQVNGASLTGLNFTAFPQTYDVGGTITDWTGAAVPGITVSIGTQKTKTNTQGQYAFTGLLPGSVTITPSNATTGVQYAFVPATQTVTIPVAAGTTEDFTAYQAFAHTFPKGKSMVGVPFNPLVPTATQVFGTPLIARWNPLASPPGYVAPTDPNSATVLDVHPGQGYFVSYGAPFTLPNLAGTPVDMTVNAALTLGPVWNMIANPFPVPLPITDLVPAVQNGTDPYVFAYDNATGSYLFVSALPGLNVARTYLNPWEGAWLRSLVGVTSVSATPPVGAASVMAVKPQSLALGQGDYVIPVIARGGTRAALYGAAGVRAAGAYEIPDPPALPGSVDLYFVNDKGEALAQQLKPAGAGPQTFKFVVSTDLPKTDITVSLPDLSQVPNNLTVMLVDEDTGRSVYARTTPQYTFESGANGAVRHFSLEIGPRGTNNLVVSAASAQQTGPGVVVTYSLSGPCQVTVEVLNVAGRLVRRLAANSLAAAGVNTTTWNLRGDSGAVVPGGLYLVRVTAVSDNGQKVQAVTEVNVNR